MGVSKVEYGGNTLIDLTNDSVTEDKMLSGVTAHNARGELVTGNIATAYGGITVHIEPTDLGYMPYISMQTVVTTPTHISPNTGGTIQLLAPYESFGDATAEDVAEGKTFTSSAGLKVTGTAKTYDSGYSDGYSDGNSDGYDEGYDEGFNEGFNEGSSEGYGEGYNAGRQDALAPLVVQKNSSASMMVGGVSYYYMTKYNTDHYSYDDFFDYEVSVESATETITIVNYTNLTMKVAISDRCTYFDGASWHDGEYETYFTVAPQSSNSGSMTAGEGSQYDWSDLYICVRFDV